MTESADADPTRDGVRTAEELARRLRVAQHQESLGGLPSPEVLLQYDEILGPGTAERLIKMAELEAEHRHHLEARRERLRYLTVLISLTLPVLSVLAAVVLLWRDSSQSLTAVVALGATGVAGLGYVVGTVRNRNDEHS